jgi:hypothetical protein
MAGAQRKVGKPQAEVRHLAGVELHVGPTESDPFDIDEKLLGPGLGRVNILNAPATRALEDESAH